MLIEDISDAKFVFKQFCKDYEIFTSRCHLYLAPEWGVYMHSCLNWVSAEWVQVNTELCGEFSYTDNARDNRSVHYLNLMKCTFKAY